MCARLLSGRSLHSTLGWRSELARRFDYVCCDTVEQFRREQLALTRAGQTKAGDQRHEKDDRHRIDDRSRFVLGWSNEDKIQALEREARGLEQRMRVAGVRIAELENRRKVLQERLGALQSLAVFDSFRDLEWQPIASEIERLERERRQLEEKSDILRTLQAQRTELEAAIASTDGTLAKSRAEQARAEERREQADEQLGGCETLLATVPEQTRSELFPRIAEMRDELLGDQSLTVESCDNREREMRDWLQSKIDAEVHRIGRLNEKIVKAMQDYRQRYPQDTQEAEASVAATGEYRSMLHRLTARRSAPVRDPLQRTAQ